ncbi:TonB-dependent receptor [Calothrix rhizosoleniae]|uniref:TonB-dependent receptor n=1 Tax=Calothrix rhizosoleniae TaxID=888997 RepID=UPI000B49F914|nr:TonB-dependent receptor [Calothrix rhizosoleniae]
MKSFTLLNYLILVSIVSLVGIQPNQALGKNEPDKGDKQIVSNRALDLLAQDNNTSIVKITGVKINSTDKGLEVILETANANNLQPVGKNEGNSLIADISNAVLALPDGENFQAENPVEGITAVSVTQVDDNNIRLTVTGTSGIPKVELFDNKQGLIFTLIPVPLTAQPPQKPTEKTQDSSEAPEQAPTTDETQSKPPAQDDEPIELVVTGEQDGYTVPNATTGTRTNTLLRDIPQSIQVIPKKIIEEQQVTNLTDVLRNVSGVQQNSGDPRGQRFQVRGFDNSSLLRDGFSGTFAGSGNSGFPELANIERVEVLKGPASVLFGATEPGGVINLVTKKPLSEPFYEFGTKVGNRSFFEPNLDISGPLTKDGRLLYRLNALYRGEESFRDFETETERVFVAPTITWKISDRTDITFNLEYLDEERPADFGLVAIGDRVADIPFDRILGEPDDINKTDYLRTGYKLEHRFSDNWKLRNAFNFIKYDTAFSSTFNASFNEGTGTLFRSFIFLDQPSSTYELQTNLVGDFTTGSIKHKLLVGVDLKRREQLNNLGRGNLRGVTPFDIFNPVYGAVSRPNPDDEPIFFDGDTKLDRLGVYLQDQVTLLPNLKLMAGIRYDTVEQKTTNRPSLFNPTGSETTQNDDAFSPRIGVVYQPSKEISLYGSYSQSFVPNTATTVSGDTLEPTRGKQFELGVRAELLQGKLTTNLAVFNIVKDNVAAPDPDNTNFSIAVGKQRSQGIELDIIGKIAPGWNVVANYAYLDAETTEDTSDLEGNRLFNVPRHSANLWTNYKIQSGSLQGLGFGIGFNFVGERFGDLANSFKVDSYFLTNAAISYERDDFRAALNFRNLFDVDYIQGTENSRTSEIYPGQGFTVIGSVSIKF